MSKIPLSTTLIILNNYEPAKINFTSLPQDTYTLHFSIINSLGNDFELSISTSHTPEKNTIVSGDNRTYKFNYTFQVTEPAPVDIAFTLTKGEKLFIRHARLPHIALNSFSQTPLLKIPDFVNAVYIEDETAKKDTLDSYRPVDIYTRLYKQMETQNNRIVIDDLRSNPSFFYELIDLETAKKQMDYVVYEKMFSQTGGSWFGKMKRKVYRKIFRSLYRLLTRNSHRKNYFAKLYRNYVNINYISESK